MTPAQLKQARKTLGLSQTEIAVILGRTQKTVSQMENGMDIPPAIALAVRAMVVLGPPDKWPTTPV
jgi:DNA-binding XRE family transcriptional regulator